MLKRYPIIRRRSLLKTIAAIPVLSTVRAAEQRSWLGPQYWANPLEDWRLIDGRIECRVSGADRNVFWLTRELSSKGGDFTIAYCSAESTNPALLARAGRQSGEAALMGIRHNKSMRRLFHETTRVDLH